VAQTTNRKYSDNLRYFRRWLQGKGVNLRETIVSVDAYADVRITVPGLHDDDRIVSVLNLTDGVDVTGDLDDDGVQASREYGSSDARFTVTALKGGSQGNHIALKAAAGTGISSPLTVTFGDRDALFGTTGHPGDTGILVTLATNTGGTLDTTDPDGPNSAKNVRVAILDAQEEQLRSEAIVDVTIENGNGEDPVGAISATALTGGAEFKQGPSTASLVTGFTSPYDTGNVRFTAVQAGAEGNDITVEFAADTSFSIDVTDDAITVNYVVGETTAKDVIDAINADPDASLLVIASPVRYGTGSAGSADEGDTAGVIETMAPTNLTGGLDPGIQLSVASDVPLASKNLKILWITRDERDEDPRA
jgi:hypothetical protein